MSTFFHIDDDEREPEETSTFTDNDFSESRDRDYRLSERSMFMSSDDDEHSRSDD